MKKIYTLIFAAIALIAFVPSAYAQKPYEDDGSGICYSKKVSEPDPDGVYTITLESFVTGSVTIKNESVPADIVLVLDLSQSMTQSYNDGSRLAALQNALREFLGVIYHNDNYKDKTNDNPREEPLGNRVSVVTFAGPRNNTNVTQIRSDLTPVTNSDGTQNNSIIAYVLGLNTGNSTTNGINNSQHYGTYSDEGMSLANSVLNGIDATRKEKASRTVVLFTDGAPGQGPGWTTSGGTAAERSPQTATRCISAAYIAKNTHTATVFTVILGDIANNDMRNYLAYTSSNYLNAESLTNPGQLNPKVDPNDASTSFAKEAGADLSGVFTSIAEASGGSDKDLTDATVSNVDIVSASFMLPPGTDATKIKLYTAKYLGTKDAEGYMQFGEKVLKGSSTDTYRVREKDEHGVVHFVGEPILVDSRLTA